MDNLLAGDILTHISDSSKWEFSEYGYGKMTVRADTPDFKGASGIDKSIVRVKPLEQKGGGLSGDDFRDMAANQFKKAETE